MESPITWNDELFKILEGMEPEILLSSRNTNCKAGAMKKLGGKEPQSLLPSMSSTCREVMLNKNEGIAPVKL